MSSDIQAWAHRVFMGKETGHCFLVLVWKAQVGERRKILAGKQGSVKESPCPTEPRYLHCLCLCCQTPIICYGDGRADTVCVCGTESSLWSDERIAWLRTLVLNKVDVHLSVRVYVSVPVQGCARVSMRISVRAHT